MFAGRFAMSNPDELMDELEENQKTIKELLLRTKDQERDIQEMKRELNRLREQFDAETISSESEPV